MRQHLRFHRRRGRCTIAACSVVLLVSALSATIHNAAQGAPKPATLPPSLEDLAVSVNTQLLDMPFFVGANYVSGHLDVYVANPSADVSALVKALAGALPTNIVTVTKSMDDLMNVENAITADVPAAPCTPARV